MKLSSRLEEAFRYAAHLHKNQKRKGTDIPYIAHLMSVTAIVLENGGDEDEAIAALLHDAVEDQGGLKTLKEVRIRFGEKVAEIVDGCTDAYTQPRPPWRKRKEAYIAHLYQASPSIILVSLADKLHNTRAILTDYRQVGDDLWDRFVGGRSDTMWYYQELSKVFREITSGFMVEEFEHIVDRIISEANSK